MDQSDFYKLYATFEASETYEKVRRLLNFETAEKFNILDVGSGSGELGKKLLSLGHRVTGLDINKEALLAPWVKEADITKAWSAAPASFDLVICCDVAEHVADPPHILNQAKLVLKPAGRLIFGVPNHFDLRQRLRLLFGGGIVHWDNLRHNQRAWDYAHIRFFTLWELKKMFEENGFFIEAEQYNFMGGGLVPARLTPRWLKKLLVRAWPGLFSGKFIFLLAYGPQARLGGGKKIIIPYTPFGL